jgi:hypothetical protein
MRGKAVGYWKQIALAEEEEYERMRDFLAEIGTLRECENHPGTYYDGDGDRERAYRSANKRISDGTIDLDGKTRRQFTDLLKEVYDDNSALEGCEECEEAFGPD